METVMKAQGATRKYTLQKEDGSEVTAQEVYDALMSGPVFLHIEMMYLVPPQWTWVDINSTQDDPTNVGLVMITISDNITITIGDKSLAPDAPVS